MTFSGFIRNILFAGVLLFAGCKMDRTAERPQAERLRYHNWWNYYEAGKQKSERGNFEGARTDFETCLGLKSGATYAFPKEMWRVRTYGLHMLDAYFPHRELGIVLFQLGDLKNAERYLEKSLLQEPSGRAKFYLNSVRKKLYAGRSFSPAEVIFDKDVERRWTRQRKQILSGRVQSKALVSNIEVNGQPDFIELAAPAIQFEREIRLSPGTNIARIEAKDLADRRISRSLVWVADWQPPQIVVRRVEPSGKLWKVEGACYDDAGLACLNVDGHAQTFLESERTISVPLEFTIDSDQTLIIYAEDLAGNRIQAALSASTLIAQWVSLAGKQFAAAGVGGVPYPSRQEAAPDTPEPGASTDTLRPTLRLSNPSAVIEVFDSECFVDGYAADGGGLAEITLNGEGLLRQEDRGARWRYLSRSLPLEPGTNAFTLTTADLAGNRAIHSFIVVRKTPEYLDEEYRLKTGVTPFAGVAGTFSSETIKKQLEAEMIREPIRFHVLERDSEGWNFILQEQRLSLSDLADPHAVLRIGKMLPADILLIGSAVAEGRGVTVFVKGVETEEGRSLCAEDVYLEGDRESFTYGIHGLALKIKQRFPLVAGKVLQIKEDKAKIDKGARDGLRAGMKFVVVSNPDKTESALKGKVVKANETLVELKTATVSKSDSVAAILPADAKHLVKPGQWSLCQITDKTLFNEDREKRSSSPPDSCPRRSSSPLRSWRVTAPTGQSPKASGANAKFNRGKIAPLQYHAVVIGINEYDSPSAREWESLKTARLDAEEIADILQREYGFSVRRLLDGEATRGAILSALDQLLDLTSNDAALVYFAGHGFYDQALDEGYWIPADARKRVNQRYAKEDWIWNVMITKLLQASPARHILVIADSCFSGSLFRGEPTSGHQANADWYRRALTKPSRYLITSGDLEPVLDTGGEHSVFAKEALHFLEYADQDIFSASDMALAIRQKVSALTGQMVRMGPLAASSDAGGELVFVRKGSSFFREASNLFSKASTRGIPARTDASSGSDRVVSRSLEQQAQDALLMRQQGATNLAQRLISSVLSAKPEDKLVLAVSSFLNRQRKSNEMDMLAKLIERIEAKKKGANQPADFSADTWAKARVIACLGPASHGKSANEDARGLLYRICLTSKLQEIGAVQVVEREALQDAVQELNLSASDISEPRAQLLIGKLLPAVFLLLGDVFFQDNGEIVQLRLVDTETSKLIGSFSEEVIPPIGLEETCEKLARRISAQAAKAKPLRAKVFNVNGTRLRAGIGQFHGATNGMVFSLATGAEKERIQTEQEKKTIYRARISLLGETESELRVESNDDLKKVGGEPLWIQEDLP